MAKTINILFPIKESNAGGVFEGTKTTDQALRSDLIALLTLRKGQRPMQSRMYSPIYDYLFEPLDEISKDELSTKIKEKIREFVNQVEVSKIIYTQDNTNNFLRIKIAYTIVSFFDLEQTIALNFPLEIPN